MYRLHTQDAIRFDHRLRFTFSHPWKREDINPFFFSSVAFFYLNTPAGTPEESYTVQELLGLYRIRDTDHQSTP